ncbi:MAG: hypothetical protein K0U13_01165 [Chlamydiae bacterium]|nr:hypothetical protein [Chlamydiota bacterium]
MPIDPLGLGPHSQTASTTFDLCDLLTPSQWTTPLSDQRAAPASCSSTRQPTEAPLDFLSWGVQSQLRAARTSPGYDLPEQSQVAGVPGFGVSPAAHLALTAAPLPITDAGLTRPLDAPPSDEELLHTLQEFSRDAGYEFFHEIEKEFDEQLIPENIAASIPFDLPLHDDRDTSPSTSFSRVTPSAHSASSAYVTPPIRAHEPQTLERDSQFFDPNKLGKNNNFQCYHCDVRWVGNMASLIEHLVTHYAADPNRNPFSPLLREYEDRIQAKLPRNQIKEVK